jgi:hypothetical protein
VGAVVSVTLTVWLHWALLPQPSIALQVRVALKVFPHAALVTVLTMEMVVALHLSVAIGGSKSQALPCSTALLALQLITGAVMSTTLTVWLHCALLPQALVATQTLVALKVLPQAGFVTVLTTVIVLLPLAMGLSKVQAAPHCTVLLVLLLQSIIGALVSTTVTF